MVRELGQSGGGGNDEGVLRECFHILSKRKKNPRGVSVALRHAR